jgi:hypothetical protein
MADRPESLSDLPRLALEAYREEYRDLSETWRSLDTKAQGLAAIAGIFLAALFAWARKVPASFGLWERRLVVAGIVVLVAAIVAAVLALEVRMVAAPPLGEETADMVSDILKKQKADEVQERIAGFYNDQITAWRDTNKDMAEESHSKASRVVFGQAALLLAAVVVAILAIPALLSTPSASTGAS